MIAALAAAALAFAGTGDQPYRLGREREVRATAYCYGQRTALGTRARLGVVAVPGGSWLFRRRIFVTGPRSTLRALHGRRWFRAEDRIGWGSRLDVFIPWGREPDCSWGRRTLRYRVAFS